MHPRVPKGSKRKAGVSIYIYIYIYRRLGGESNPGNLNGSCVRNPVAGLWTAISGPARVPCAVPLGLVF